MKTISISLLAAATLLAGASASAAGVSLGGRVSSLGYGLEMSAPVYKNINLRGGMNSFSYSYDGQITEADYQADLDFKTFSLLADWHPWSNGIRLSGGLVLNNSEMTGTAVARDQSFDIGGTTITQGADAQANLKVTFPSSAPYLGFGYDSSMFNRSGFSFTAELGVMFQGSPEIGLTVSGADIGTGPGQINVTQADIDAEIQKANDDVKDLEMWPVLGLGLSYRF